MRHFDLQVSDFVDGRLGDDDRDRVLAHLAVCDDCRREAADLRMVKGALAALGGVPAPPSLTQRLAGIAGPDGPLPVDHEALPAGMVSVGHWRDADPASATGWIDRHRRSVRFAAGGMVSAGAMMLLFASLGALPESGEADPVTPANVVPAVDRYMQEHARSTGTLPFADPASYLAPGSSLPGGGQ